MNTEIQIPPSCTIPKKYTVTIPVTFTMIMGEGWTHGSMLMSYAPAEVKSKGKIVGEIGADMGGNPFARLHGGTFHANSLDIFEALHGAIKKADLPKENPEPSPAS